VSLALNEGSGGELVVALQFPVPGQELVDARGRVILQARQAIERLKYPKA
jgi:hypothetical protein